MREQEMPVLRTYAEAVDRALRTGGVGDSEAVEEARGLRQVLSDQPQLVRFLDQPAIGRDDKKALLRRVFEGRISPVMLHLPMLLVDKNRGGVWGRILDAFIELVERRQGVHPAEVTTACVLDTGQREMLRESLERFTGMKLKIAFREDASVMGGVLFHYGDVMIDDTVRGAIDDLRRHLETVKID